MPKKIEFTEEDFLMLQKEMIGMGYTLKKGHELKLDIERLGLSAPRTKKGREATFIFNARGLSSIMHTSFDVVHKEWREEDLGWPLMTEGDYAVYFSKPLRRTKNFLTQFLRRAWINKWRVENRPICDDCKRYMKVKERYKTDEVGLRHPTGQYYWSCINTPKHKSGKPKFLNWDQIGHLKKLPPKAKEFVDMMRKRVADYKERDKKAGVIRTPMRKIRKKWPMERPENREPISRSK